MKMQRDGERKVEVYLPIQLEAAIAVVLQAEGYHPVTRQQCDGVFQALIDAVLVRTGELFDADDVLFSAVHEGAVFAALSD